MNLNDLSSLVKMLILLRSFKPSRDPNAAANPAQQPKQSINIGNKIL